MGVEYKRAKPEDAVFLAPMNKRMIEDQNHRNPMSVPELKVRMETWLQGEYEAVYAEEDGNVLGYALFKREAEGIYLRQLFIERGERTKGNGGKLFRWLEKNLWDGEKVRIEVLPGNSAG